MVFDYSLSRTILSSYYVSDNRLGTDVAIRDCVDRDAAGLVRDATEQKEARKSHRNGHTPGSEDGGV